MTEETVDINKFIWHGGELNVHRQPQGLIVRDVLNSSDFGTPATLYAVQAAGAASDLAKVDLEEGDVEIPPSFDRSIADANGRSSLLFNSVDMMTRLAALEEDDGIKAPRSYTPYIPNAPLYYGVIKLGPERLI
jgi:hypothetical protein